MPLTVTRRGTGVLLWGLARPTNGATTVLVEVSDNHRRFRALLSKPTNTLGYWTARSRFRRGRRWRVHWVSASGTVYEGPPIRAYDARGRLQP